jgi:hypothetical protein
LPVLKSGLKSLSENIHFAEKVTKGIIRPEHLTK